MCRDRVNQGGGRAQGKLGWNWKQEKEVPRQKGIIDANRSDGGMHDENVSATEMMEALRRAEVRCESGRTAGRNNKQKGTGLLRRRRCMCEGSVQLATSVGGDIIIVRKKVI